MYNAEPIIARDCDDKLIGAPWFFYYNILLYDVGALEQKSVHLRASSVVAWFDAEKSRKLDSLLSRREN